MSFSPSQIRYPEFFLKGWTSTDTPSTWTDLDSITYGDLIFWAINISNSDSISHKVAFSHNGNNQSVMFEADVPARAGYDGNAPFQCLPVWMPSAYQYLVLGKENGPSLWVTFREAIGASQEVFVACHGGYV